MALRAKKPERSDKRFKALFYGKEKVGKTTAAISFPKPYIIDTEGGCKHNDYVDIMERTNAYILDLNDIDEIIKECKSLLSEKHDFKTLVIDPLTCIYDDLIDKCEDRVGNQFGKHISTANRKMKHLLRLISRLDMNVIIISQSKLEYGDKMAVIGETFDCYKKLGYVFDLVLRVEIKNNERMAFVQCTRMKKEFPEFQYIPFSYEEISKRYGIDILEKESLPQALANEEDVKELLRLIDLLKIPTEIIEKWLTKAEAETFDEMSKENIVSCINFLKSKIDNKAA